MNEAFLLGASSLAWRADEKRGLNEREKGAGTGLNRRVSDTHRQTPERDRQAQTEHVTTTAATLEKAIAWIRGGGGPRITAECSNWRHRTNSKQLFSPKTDGRTQTAEISQVAPLKRSDNTGISRDKTELFNPEGGSEREIRRKFVIEAVCSCCAATTPTTPGGHGDGGVVATINGFGRREEKKKRNELAPISGSPAKRGERDRRRTM